MLRIIKKVEITTKIRKVWFLMDNPMDKDKPFLYFITKTAAALSSIVMFLSAEAGITVAVIAALSFICVFMLELLLEQTKVRLMGLRITLILSLLACFFLGIIELFPLFIVLLVHLLDITVEERMFYLFLGFGLFLAFILYPPSLLSSVITVLLIVLLLYGRYLLASLKRLGELNDQHKDTIKELGDKLNDVKRLTKTLKYTTSAEERNRIAARIHDQVGHGISGSIILLEAALLVMKDDQQKAAQSIQKAIANLRTGVDEIRTALREERVEHYLIGINDIKALLEEFKINYNKSVELKTSGDLDRISLEVWTCIHDNLKECLTNTLKHSAASRFHLSIDVFQKIIKVEYKDNGTNQEEFVKGLGLEAMEERTVNAKGRCFFRKDEQGFTVTNIFTY